MQALCSNPVRVELDDRTYLFSPTLYGAVADIAVSVHLPGD